jgi:hypothetical protein
MFGDRNKPNLFLGLIDQRFVCCASSGAGGAADAAARAERGRTLGAHHRIRLRRGRRTDGQRCYHVSAGGVPGGAAAVAEQRQGAAGAHGGRRCQRGTDRPDLQVRKRHFWAIYI